MTAPSVARRPGRRWLIVIAVFLLASFSGILAIQYQQWRSLRQTTAFGEDNVVWSFYQLMVEYQKLLHVLSQPPTALANSNNLQLRYDIFVSRVGVINESNDRVLLQDSPLYHKAMTSLANFVTTADRLLGPEPTATPDLITLQSLYRYLEELQPQLQDLVLEATRLNAEFNVRRRQVIGEQTLVSTAITLFQFLLIVLFAALTLRLLRQTERKRDELQQLARHLEAANLEAQSANRAKSEFLAVMSHEIRTPMNAVLGSIALLGDSPLNNEQRRFLDNAHHAGTALLSLLNNILDFSKIEAGRLELDIGEFELRALVEDLLELLHPRAAVKGIAFAACLDPTLPRSVRGDQGRLRQVLLNLADNAIKFTHRGGVALYVSRTNDLDWLRFEIVDTGIGIPAQARDRLFHEFVQADSSHTRRFGGTGLGLVIARRLTVLMGGRLGLASEEGVGSQFHCLLPLPAYREETLGAPAALRGQRVLLAHSNPLLLCLLRRQLELWGMTVQTLTSRREFLRQCLQSPDPAYDITLVSQSWPAISTLPAGLGRLVPVSSSGADTPLPEGLHPLPQPEAQLMLCWTDTQLAALLQAAPPPTTIAPKAAAGRGGRLLLAEDSPANQLVAVGMLNRAGFDVDVVGNGREAVAAVQRQAYDLVLMDLAMPEMDGISATRLIRALPDRVSRIPIIAMTANVVKEDLDQCLAAGMNDYILKPVERQHLLTAIERWRSQSAIAAPTAAPATAETALPLLDPTVLTRLEQDMPPELLVQVAQLFLQEAQRRTQAIETAVAAADSAVLRQECHALKSGAQTLGLFALSDLARQIESACRADKQAEAFTLAATLPTLVVASLQQLAQHYAGIEFLP